MSCVVICMGDFQKERFQELNLSIKEYSRNTFFYWIGIDGRDLDVMDWKQIIHVKTVEKLLQHQ